MAKDKSRDDAFGRPFGWIFPDLITAQSLGRFLAKGETGAHEIITLK
jgi:hypothetical protein